VEILCNFGAKREKTLSGTFERLKREHSVKRSQDVLPVIASAAKQSQRVVEPAMEIATSLRSSQ
jgi:hypothetical protein